MRIGGIVVMRNPNAAGSIIRIFEPSCYNDGRIIRRGWRNIPNRIGEDDRR